MRWRTRLPQWLAIGVLALCLVATVGVVFSPAGYSSQTESVDADGTTRTVTESVSGPLWRVMPLALPLLLLPLTIGTLGAIAVWYRSRTAMIGAALLLAYSLLGAMSFGLAYLPAAMLLLAASVLLLVARMGDADSPHASKENEDHLDSAGRDACS